MQAEWSLIPSFRNTSVANKLKYFTAQTATEASSSDIIMSSTLSTLSWSTDKQPSHNTLSKYFLIWPTRSLDSVQQHSDSPDLLLCNTKSHNHQQELPDGENTTNSSGLEGNSPYSWCWPTHLQRLEAAASQTGLIAWTSSPKTSCKPLLQGLQTPQHNPTLITNIPITPPLLPVWCSNFGLQFLVHAEASHFHPAHKIPHMTYQRSQAIWSRGSATIKKS